MKSSQKKKSQVKRMVHVRDEGGDTLLCGKARGKALGPGGLRKGDVVCRKCAVILLTDKNTLADRSNLLASRVRSQENTVALLSEGADRMLAVIERIVDLEEPDEVPVAPPDVHEGLERQFQGREPSPVERAQERERQRDALVSGSGYESAEAAASMSSEHDALVKDLGSTLREMRLPTPENRLSQILDGLTTAGWVIQRPEEDKQD